MSARRTPIVLILTALLTLGQDVPHAAPQSTQNPAAGSATQAVVDTVLQMLKMGMSEFVVVSYLQRQNKPANLTPSDMEMLRKAGATDKVIALVMNPAAEVPPAAAPVRPATVPPPVTSPAPPTPAPPVQYAPPTLRLEPATAVTAESGCLAPRAVSALPNSGKRRLAVSPFDYSAVRTQVTAMFNNDVNIGQGIRAMLTVKMAQSRSVVLLEREKLDAVMKEQDRVPTNRIKQGTGAKPGGLTGADAMLFGDIVIFGRDDQAKQTGGGGGFCAIPVIGCTIQQGARAMKTDKAVVAINLRLVDAGTGEILESAEARGESKRKSTDWGAMAGTWRGSAAASSSMTSSNFQETIIGEATQDAVNKIAEFINQRMSGVGAKSRTIEGRVAGISGCNMTLTVGANDGVHVGDRFEILRILGQILDPQTHEVLDLETEKVGDFVVSTVRDRISTGVYGGDPVSASEILKPGYAARMVSQ